MVMKQLTQVTTWMSEYLKGKLAPDILSFWNIKISANLRDNSKKNVVKPSVRKHPKHTAMTSVFVNASVNNSPNKDPNREIFNDFGLILRTATFPKIRIQIRMKLKII
jgi:hypothetical protein